MKTSNKTTEKQKEKHIDDLVTATICGLNLLIAQATSAEVGTVVRILHDAKEDLVHWAVKQNFQETFQEKFVNLILYHNAMFSAADVIATLAAVTDKKKLLKELEKGDFKTQLFSLVEDLRELS